MDPKLCSNVILPWISVIDIDVPKFADFYGLKQTNKAKIYPIDNGNYFYN